MRPKPLILFTTLLAWARLRARGEGYEEEKITAYKIETQPHIHVGPIQKNFEILRSTFMGGDKYPHPLVVTAFDEKGWKDAQLLVASMLLTNPHTPLLVFDLGLMHHTRLHIAKSWCNVMVLPMPKAFADIPPHDPQKADLGLRAWMPFVISEVLDNITTSAIIYTDAQGMFLRSLSSPAMNQFWSDANTSLVLGRPCNQWQIGDYTHATTMNKLYANARDKDMMLSPLICLYQLAVANNPEVRDVVLQPWTKCVLDKECIAPEGGIWRNGDGCNITAEYHGNFTCHLHRGGNSVLSIILHKLYYRLSKRNEWRHDLGMNVYTKGGEIVENKLKFKHKPPYYLREGDFAKDMSSPLRHAILCSRTKGGHHISPCDISAIRLGKEISPPPTEDPAGIIKSKCLEIKRDIQGWSLGKFIPIKGDGRWPREVLNSDDPP
mmetsp:Transcript_15886/g.30450  ORF Transcript_15886/g.30450 Transcript_15886/m.30450 type:complete len:436 (+) Transcript_15886:99-1406(+)